MEDNINWKSYYQQEPIEPDVYFKFVCFYQAMTELYDRSMVGEISHYERKDIILGRTEKIYSERYARELFGCVVEYVCRKTNAPFDMNRWKKEEERGKRYSAQFWVDMIESCKREKDEIILDMIENIWEYGRTRKDDEHRQHVIIKNPFLETK